jgi:hypothetical protein
MRAARLAAFIVFPQRANRADQDRRERTTAARRLRRVGLFATLLLTFGCSDDPVSASLRGLDDQSISVPVGTEINVILGTTGPGEYGSPPELSSGSISFVDMAYVGPATPAGVTQRFRFRAMRRGNTQIIFRLTVNHSTQRTVVVHSVDVF